MAGSSVYWIGTEELMEIFEYTNRKAFYNAIKLKRFPIPTFKFGGKIYADKRVVRQYFDRQLEALEDEISG